jgi:hypothetical protein
MSYPRSQLYGSAMTGGRSYDGEDDMTGAGWFSNLAKHALTAAKYAKDNQLASRGLSAFGSLTGNQTAKNLADKARSVGLGYGGSMTGGNILGDVLGLFGGGKQHKWHAQRAKQPIPEGLQEYRVWTKRHADDLATARELMKHELGTYDGAIAAQSFSRAQGLAYKEVIDPNFIVQAAIRMYRATVATPEYTALIRAEKDMRKVGRQVKRATAGVAL